MAEYLIQDSTLTNIADAIRTMNGTSDSIIPEDMPNAIYAIDSNGSIDTVDSISVDLESVGFTTADLRYVSFNATVGDTIGRAIVHPNTKIVIEGTTAGFGNATKEDVAEGVSFTSSEGFRITGTATFGYAPGSLVKATAANVVVGTFESSKSLTLSIASSVKESNGEVVSNTSWGNVNISSPSHTDRINNIRGNYVKDANNKYYYIPNEATCEITGSSPYEVIFNGIQQMFVLSD